MGLDYRNLHKVFDGWDHVIDAVEDARRLAVTEMGKAVKVEVEGQIVARGVNDDNYHVRDWQRYRVGTRGGYASVKPSLQRISGRTASSRKITMYLERGHGARPPTGMNKQYRPRLERAQFGVKGNAFVKGYQFYSFTRPVAGDKARRAAEKVLAKLENLFDL